MDRILKKLDEKNDLLEKFYRINESELFNFKEGRFQQLAQFYESREGILKIIGKLDAMLESDLQWEGEDLSDGHTKQLIETLDYKEDLVRRILGQDLEILSLVETEKSNIIKNLRSVRETRNVITKYNGGATTILDDFEV